MIFAENHWRHRDISKEILGKFQKKFRDRAEDRSIAPFSKTEAALLEEEWAKREERHFGWQPAAKAEIGRAEEAITKLGRGETPCQSSGTF